MKTDKTIIAEFKKRKKLTTQRLSKQYANTKKCQSFYSGDIMSYEDTVQFTAVPGKKKKVLVKFNKVKPYVNAVKGFMAQNRKKPKYEARVEQDKLQEMFTGYANAVSGYVRDNADADQIETQQDGDMLINGYGATETALSYGEGYASSEVDGEILMGRLDPLCVGFDPYAKATNLTDARWVYYVKEYHKDEAVKLFDDADEEDFEEYNDEEQNADYQYMPYGGVYDKIAPMEYANEADGMVKVYFYQWYDIEPYYKIPNPLYDVEDAQAATMIDGFLQNLSEEMDDDGFDPRAEVMSVNAETKAKLEEYFGQLLGEIYEFNRKVFYTAVVSGDKVFTSYKSISQQGYTIQFKTGDYDAANGIWTGMVNSMMEPALYYNKALTELMFTIASNSKGGVMVEEDAVDDIREFEATYNKTDGVVVVNEGALAAGKVQEKKSPAIPTGLDEIVGMSDKAMTDVNGFDTTFMGSRENANDTAAFQRQRIKQAVSLLACYFDSATLYQKRHARMMLDLIRVFVENNQNMSIRVIGEEGQAMFLRLQSKQLSVEYDVVVNEAPLSAQDKQEQATILTTIGDKVALTDPASAKIIYGMAIELMPLDFSMKEKIKSVLVPEEGEIDPAYVKQLEEQVQILMDEQRQANLAKILAGAQVDEAKAQEILAKVEKTKADTADTLESAKNKSLENTLIEKQQYSEVKVNI